MHPWRPRYENRIHRCRSSTSVLVQIYVITQSQEGREIVVETKQNLARQRQAPDPYSSQYVGPDSTFCLAADASTKIVLYSM
jgi:hypothetical protein